jgi:SAM-dependent methyltransferase
VSIDRYYGWLAWFQDLATRVGHPSGHDQLTVHRRLRSCAGPPSGAVVHATLLEALRAAGPSASPRALDAGCGLGGTTFFLQAALGGDYHGLTLSAVQCDRATDEARRRGLAGRCRFHVRNYDDDLTDLLPGGADLVVAIESLAHAADPARTVAQWGRLLARGGLLAIVDDMPVAGLSDDDTDGQAFRRGWLCPRVASADQLRAALAAAGLLLRADRDLTPFVPLRAPASLALRHRLSRAVLPLARLTRAGVLLDALHGGLALERLYRRGLMEYRLIVAGRTASLG